MPTDTVIIMRLLLAAVLGALVGLEREVHGREAGIRTYLLVSLGSALIMILSQYLSFSHSSASPGAAAIDPGRIAAQAITGIGFLGAGVIIRYKDSIRGLTTAACMWVMCAVGLSVGAGYYLYASVVSLMTLVSLIGVKMFTKKLAIDWYRDLVVVSEEREEQFERVQRAIEGRKATIAAFSLKKDRARQETTLMFRIKFHAAGTFDRKVVAEVYALPGIKSVELK